MTRHEQSALGAALWCGALFVFIYAAFGVHSPFLPPLLQDRGLDASVIGLLLATATGVKLIAAPLTGRLGDRFGMLSITLAAALLGSALASLLYVTSAATLTLIAIVLTHALFTGPIAPLSDAIGLTAARQNAAIYGRMRGAGSLAFILGIVASGLLVSRYGISAAFIVNSALLLVAVVLSLLARGGKAIRSDLAPPTGSFRDLIKIRPFRLVIVISGLILGSHALHDGFTMIRWREAGIDAALAGALWALAVAAEVIVFLFVGGPVLARLGARGACLIACLAGIVRWSVMALTAAPLAMSFIQPLHGLTFALLHLACMQVISDAVPQVSFGAAQGLYATLGAGAASVALTAVAGLLFEAWGASAFWAMAALCACAAPAILMLSDEEKVRVNDLK